MVLAMPRLDGVGGFAPVHVAEHHHAGEDQRAGVDHVLVGVLRRGAVGGFEDRDFVGLVRARGHAEAADLGGEGVGEVVAVEVRRGEHRVLGGTQQDLLEHRVGDAVLDHDLAGRRGAGQLGLGDGDVAELLLARPRSPSP